MSQIVNTLSHRVYRDGRPVKVGGLYEGDADPENGQISASSREGKAWIDAHNAREGRSEIEEGGTEITSPVLAAAVAANAAGGHLATAGVRDPNADAETVIDNAAEVAEREIAQLGKPVGVVPTNPETGEVIGTEIENRFQGEPDPGHPAPEPAPDSAGTLTSKAPDDPGRGITDAPTEQPSPAVGSGVPAYGEGVTFASGPAENAADELVAAGKLDPSLLKPGEGSGEDGGFKADDVRALVSAPSEPSPSGQTSTPAISSDVAFASPQAESAALDAVKAGTLSPSKLKPGKGSGEDGAFKAGDVRSLVTPSE